VATKVEGNGDITEADLTAEGTAAKVEIVEAVRRTLLATKAPESANQKIKINVIEGVKVDEGGASATIRIKEDDNIKFSQFVTTDGTAPIVWKLGDIVWTKDEIPYSPNKTSVYTGTVGAASVTITVKPFDEAEAPKITIKPGDGVVIGEGGTTATITRVIGSEINFNELVTANKPDIVWRSGEDVVPKGILSSYTGLKQSVTGTVSDGRKSASVTITVTPPEAAAKSPDEAAKSPEEAAKPAQFTIKIKEGTNVYQKDRKNYIDKKPSDRLDLNTLVVVEPADAGITWAAGFISAPSNGILENTSENTEIIYTGTVYGSTFGNSKAVISITVKTTGAAAGGRRKKGSTLRRRVGRILRKTGTRAKR
jgi:hypothetical protein